uniref:T-cell acute lymphocytic leukemia 1 n=1 Tax=Cyprinus carpio carpio TaxID=630221 RepID=A0A9J7X9G4_CYPCA
MVQLSPPAFPLPARAMLYSNMTPPLTTINSGFAGEADQYGMYPSSRVKRRPAPYEVEINDEKAEQALPNWLTGIIAVAVFLFLVFIVFLVNKAWCETPSEPEAVPTEYAMTNGSTCETSLDAVRSSEDPKAYENAIVHQTDEKVTKM